MSNFEEINVRLNRSFARLSKDYIGFVFTISILIGFFGGFYAMERTALRVIDFGMAKVFVCFVIFFPTFILFLLLGMFVQNFRNEKKDQDSQS